MVNLADEIEASADRHPAAEAVVVDGERLTYAELDERAARMASVLATRGIGPGDAVGVLLGNTAEHLEVLLACFKQRALAVNLNTRYTAAELAEVLAHSGARLVVHEEDLGPLLPPGMPGLARGGSYEEAIAGARPAARIERSADDRYVLYTGGTTETPRGVLWRHGDLRQAALLPDVELAGRRVLVACPLFHGTGQWLALAALRTGATVVTTRHRSIRPDVLWPLARSESATHLVLVGDAYAAPLVEWLELCREPPPPELTVVLSGGATLSPGVTARLLEALPDVVVVDGFGASETGGHATAISVPGRPPVTAFTAGDDTAVLGDDLRPLDPSSRSEGWLARRGALPLGYLHDPEATARRFPVVDGVRWALTGDRARWAEPGRIEVLGRGARTINTGGEKVHPEEVEATLRTHPQVADAVVVGAEDERWGELVTAVVQPAGRPPSLAELADHCRATLAGFKVPRRLVVVEEVRRTAAGKPDYPWAASVSRQMDGGTGNPT